jgi:hypothetical protein
MIVHLLVITRNKKKIKRTFIFRNIPRGRCEDNIKRDIKELGWDGMDWTELVQADKSA